MSTVFVELCTFSVSLSLLFLKRCFITFSLGCAYDNLCRHVVVDDICISTISFSICFPCELNLVPPRSFLVFFLHRFWKRSIVDKWHRVLPAECLPVIKLAMSKYWWEVKSFIHSHWPYPSWSTAILQRGVAAPFMLDPCCYSNRCYSDIWYPNP